MAAQSRSVKTVGIWAVLRIKPVLPGRGIMKNTMSGYKEDVMTSKKMTRREALNTAAVLGVSSALPALWARPALASEKMEKTPMEAERKIAEVTGGEKVIESRVMVESPKLAENGAVVPVKILVESPMTAQDHVKNISIIIDHNPMPLIMSVNLTPANGKADLSTRVRMRKKSPIRVYATMSDGAIYYGQNITDVTIGGC